MIAAPVQRDIDGVQKWSHSPRVRSMGAPTRRRSPHPFGDGVLEHRQLTRDASDGSSGVNDVMCYLGSERRRESSGRRGPRCPPILRATSLPVQPRASLSPSCTAGGISSSEVSHHFLAKLHGAVGILIIGLSLRRLVIRGALREKRSSIRPKPRPMSVAVGPRLFIRADGDASLVIKWPL